MGLPKKRQIISFSFTAVSTVAVLYLNGKSEHWSGAHSLGVVAYTVFLISAVLFVIACANSFDDLVTPRFLSYVVTIIIISIAPILLGFIKVDQLGGFFPLFFFIGVVFPYVLHSMWETFNWHGVLQCLSDFLRPTGGRDVERWESSQMLLDPGAATLSPKPNYLGASVGSDNEVLTSVGITVPESRPLLTTLDELNNPWASLTL